MVLPKNAHQKIKHFFSKIVGILFHLSPSPMFTAALNSFSKDGGGKKISKERKKRGFLATPAVFSYSNNKTCKTRNSNSSSNSNNSNNSSNSSKKGVVRLYNATRSSGSDKSRKNIFDTAKQNVSYSSQDLEYRDKKSWWGKYGALYLAFKFYISLPVPSWACRWAWPPPPPGTAPSSSPSGWREGGRERSRSSSTGTPSRWRPEFSRFKYKCFVLKKQPKMFWAFVQTNKYAFWERARRIFFVKKKCLIE